MVSKRDFYYFDAVQLFLIICLLFLSLIFVYSATYSALTPYSIFFKKQCIGTVVGLLIYGIFCKINHLSFIKVAQAGYFFVLFLLAFTLFKGSIGMGAQRWIDLGLFRFQPSELTKIFFPSVVLFFSEQEHITPSSILQIISLLLISFILIAKQPDLGTGLVLLFSITILLWLCKVLSNKFLITLSCCLLLITPLLWRALKPYQQKRIAVFLGYGDVQKEAYQREQALIAIGSGGLFGKGFLQGSQNKLQFLPEGRTDFIFAVICEEWGLMGALLIMSIYALLFYRFYTRIVRLTQKKAQLLAIGMIIHIAISMIINCAMVLGMMPIVGIPLPLISYGITHLWVALISLGIFQNITMDRLYRND